MRGQRHDGRSIWACQRRTRSCRRGRPTTTTATRALGASGHDPSVTASDQRVRQDTDTAKNGVAARSMITSNRAMLFKHNTHIPDRFHGRRGSPRLLATKTLLQRIAGMVEILSPREVTVHPCLLTVFGRTFPNRI